MRIGGAVESAIDRAIIALIHRRPELARQVTLGDDKIDALEVEIEEECLELLALYQPVAGDLRFIVAVMKVNNDLERMGDLAVNIAHRASYLGTHEAIQLPEDFPKMAEQVRGMVRDALDALVHEDSEKARAILRQDDFVDSCHRSMFKVLEDMMRADTNTIVRAVQTLSASRNLERIADLATNIAEDVIFMSEGAVVRRRQPDDLYESAES